jgi:hypothetical protein
MMATDSQTAMARVCRLSEPAKREGHFLTPLVQIARDWLDTVRTHCRVSVVQILGTRNDADKSSHELMLRIRDSAPHGWQAARLGRPHTLPPLLEDSAMSRAVGDVSRLTAEGTPRMHHGPFVFHVGGRYPVQTSIHKPPPGWDSENFLMVKAQTTVSILYIGSALSDDYGWAYAEVKPPPTRTTRQVGWLALSALRQDLDRISATSTGIRHISVLYDQPDFSPGHTE